MKAELVPINGDPPIPITRDVTVVGRREFCDVKIDHNSLSKRHCVLVRTDGLLMLRDLAATNGTKVNGQKVSWAALLPNDRLTLGRCKFKVYLGSDDAPSPSERYRKAAVSAVSSKRGAAAPPPEIEEDIEILEAADLMVEEFEDDEELEILDDSALIGRPNNHESPPMRLFRVEHRRPRSEGSPPGGLRRAARRPTRRECRCSRAIHSPLASTGGRSRRRILRPAFSIEALEGRRMLSTFTVSNVDDCGAGSLRQALLSSNSATGSTANSITFDIGTGGPATIMPRSALPIVTQAVVIDGTTQPGSRSTPAIVLDGVDAGVGDGRPGFAGLQQRGEGPGHRRLRRRRRPRLRRLGRPDHRRLHGCHARRRRLLGERRRRRPPDGRFEGEHRRRRRDLGQPRPRGQHRRRLAGEHRRGEQDRHRFHRHRRARKHRFRRVHRSQLEFQPSSAAPRPAPAT